MTSIPRDHEFAPDERPSLPGSPFIPRHPAGRRVAYGVVGVLIGLSISFPNGLVTANVATLPGSIGTYIAQVSWLPAIYVAMNASGNLTLVKARIQFGIPAVTLALLGLYASAAVIQLVFPTFTTALIAQGINGMMAGALISLSVYYLLQVFTPKTRSLALVVGLGLAQIGTPLARIVPVEFLGAEHWRGLHLTELITALILITATLAVPLPPSERSPAFSALDLLSIALLVPAFLLVCGVLGIGRVVWWTDAPALGWMLAAAIPLFLVAILIEMNRLRPLFQVRWFGSINILRFAAVAFLVRLALVEQTSSSVGLLSAAGLTDDQLRPLFICVALSMIAGVVAAALTLSEARLPFQVMTAALVIAAGAYLDSNSSNLTRPPQLYLSQSLLGFGATLFMGPAMIYGLQRMAERGPAFFVTLAVLVSTTQNVGSLAGSAMLGSYQVIEARTHATSLADHVVGSSPDVAARISGSAAALSADIGDPTLRGQEGGKLLAQALARESGVLAFNDVFRLVAVLGVFTALYVLYLIALNAIGKKLRPAHKAEL